jgi:hypothetical protein
LHISAAKGPDFDDDYRHGSGAGGNNGTTQPILGKKYIGAGWKACATL